MRKLLIAAIAAVTLTGCASPYDRFYQPAPAQVLAKVERYTGEPQIIASTGDPRRDREAMFTQGYAVVGVAAFNGPKQRVSGAIAKAKEVGASHIVISAQYARTVTGAIPMTTYETSTAVSTGNVNVYSGGRNAFGTYNGTTTISSPTTTYIPYAIDRYDQGALFFAPMPRHGIGLLSDPLTPEQAQQFGTNRGAYVRAVRRGSPAYKADILPHDVVLSVNGLDPADDAAKAVFADDGPTSLVVVVLRNGASVTKTIELAADRTW